MYCPGCGANNNSEIKFCTRCGTDLAAVSEALAGNKSDRAELDERMVRLFKDYYEGRRSVTIGAVVLAIGMVKLLLGELLSMPDRFPYLFPFLVAFSIYGLLTLFSGLSKWISASSEIKAIERATSPTSLSTPHRQPLQAAASFDELSKSYDTDAVSIPASVTESTTRQLAARSERPETEARSH